MMHCPECDMGIETTEWCHECQCCFDCCECDDGTFSRDELGIDPEEDYGIYEDK